jgi:hypothetical protein
MALYVEAVWPKDNGVSKHPLFCCLKKKGVKTDEQVRSNADSLDI